MNDKIKELAKQSTNPDYDGDDGPMNELNVGKFAKSIIKETIKIIQATAAESIDLDRTLVENVSWTVNDIKKHFGVE